MLVARSSLNLTSSLNKTRTCNRYFSRERDNAFIFADYMQLIIGHSSFEVMTYIGKAICVHS